jgi:hypothetical protein
VARIRTIKPELWTDPEFTELSLSARLLLIAMLNFATDYGVLPDKPRQIKMQCLPADSVDVAPLIEELIGQRFVYRATAPNGDKVLVIRTFTKNQKINRPSKGRWDDPTEWGNPQLELEAYSLNTHGSLTEAHPPEGKGRDNSDSSEGMPSTSLHPLSSEPAAIVTHLAERFRA